MSFIAQFFSFTLAVLVVLLCLAVYDNYRRMEEKYRRRKQEAENTIRSVRK